MNAVLIVAKPILPCFNLQNICSSVSVLQCPKHITIGHFVFHHLNKIPGGPKKILANSVL